MASKALEIGAAYIRVSTDDQTELSPDAQLRVILDEAKKDGCIFRKNCASVPEERSAIPLQTEQSSAG